MLQPQARITPLADRRRLGIRVKRFDRELSDAQATLGNKATHPFRVDLFHCLRRHHTKLTGIRPAESFARFRNFAQQNLRAGRTKAAERFNRLKPQVVSPAARQVTFGQAQKLHIGALLPGHADLIDCERANRPIK